MTIWSDQYKAELDSLSASPEFKARLLALQHTVACNADSTTKQTSAQPKTAPDNTVLWPQKAIQQSILFCKSSACKRYALTAVACFAIGVFSHSFSASISQNNALNSSGADSAPALPPRVTNQTQTEGGALHGEVDIEGFSAADMARTPTTFDVPNTISATPQQQDSLAVATRKLVYTANVNLESTTYDDTLNTLQQALLDTNGYLENSQESTRSEQRRFCELTYRVPSTAYQTFVDSAVQSGVLLQKSEHVNDVTTEYLDITAHIDTLRAQRDRLRELQSTATNLTDLLEVEDALQEAQYQLDSLQGQMNYYNDQIDYATVSIQVTEVVNYTAPSDNVFAKLQQAFMDGIFAFGNTLLNIALWVVQNTIWVLLTALVVVACLLQRKKRN